jgi:hypothetical protein
LNPSLEAQPLDRSTFIAIKGQTARILSHPPTDEEVTVDWSKVNASKPNGEPNKKRSVAWRLAKKHFPQPVKDAIKKTMRTVGLMDKSTGPDFRPSLPKDLRPKQ